MALFFGALGLWSLWQSFHPGASSARSLGLAPALLGVVSLYFAWRALGQWASRRRG